MNIIGKPDVWETPLKDWWNKNLQPLIDGTPDVGEMRVKWYPEAFAEENGEFVTVERWNGQAWEQHGLDVHMTLEDLDKLNEELGGEL